MKSAETRRSKSQAGIALARRESVNSTSGARDSIGFNYGAVHVDSDRERNSQKNQMQKRFCLPRAN